MSCMAVLACAHECVHVCVCVCVCVCVLQGTALNPDNSVLAFSV